MRETYPSSVGAGEVLRLAIELDEREVPNGETVSEIVAIEQVAGRAGGTIAIRETGRTIDEREIGFWYDGATAAGRYRLRFTLTTSKGETLTPELDITVN